MRDLSVIIRWPVSTETLHLGNLAMLHEGSSILSLERWRGYPELTRYRASVESMSLTTEQCQLSIRYRRKNNYGQALENAAWGVSEVEIDLLAYTVTAEWFDDEPEVHQNAIGKARLVTEDDFVDLGTVFVEVQKRRQAAFRKKILELDQKCVLSGENTRGALEASHLVDVKGKGGFGTSNGILLRADLHKLFDRKLLKINTDGSAYFPPGSKISTRYAKESKNWKLAPDVLQRVSKRLAERIASDG